MPDHVPVFECKDNNNFQTISIFNCYLSKRETKKELMLWKNLKTLSNQRSPYL